MRGLALLGFALFLAGAPAGAQHRHDPSMQGTQKDVRELVRVPEPMRLHLLANMRDHLAALSQIQDALGAGQFDEAARIAEQRLGMSSLEAHGAHEAARYMPQGMQDTGTAMHRSASQFAVELQKTAVTTDLKPAMAALARTTQACVACHALYRLQ